MHLSQNSPVARKLLVELSRLNFTLVILMRHQGYTLELVVSIDLVSLDELCCTLLNGVQVFNNKWCIK